MSERMVPRTEYIRQLDSFRKDVGLIKVITGVRRCGKSELMRQFRQHLMDDGVPEGDIIYVDLERKRYVIDSERMLYETIRNSIRSEECYILLDEVQLVKGWERVVTTARNEFGANVYITGSNSKMLSDELGTHITGRFVQIHVMPFSFREFLQRYPIDPDNGHTQRFVQYMHWGGMPIIDLDDGNTKNRAILRGVYDSIVNHDIRPRVDLDQSILENVTSFMLSNTGNLTSAGRITEGALIGDPRTTEKYLYELCKCYIFYKSERYDIIGAKHMQSNAKYYPVDTGMMNTILYGHELNEAAMLECIVFLELVRHGYRVSVGSYRSREIDFTAWMEECPPEFYQVALRLDDRRTLDRELDSFRRMGVGCRKVLVTLDRDQYDVPDDVELVNVVDWLLDPI
ncbi:MAG: ATP-binding protein [Candidatus Methanomethylophilaceae archaeon]|nr:ATP-binding protein [Candidatus Methanomethylophilaceae archaeon]